MIKVFEGDCLQELALLITVSNDFFKNQPMYVIRVTMAKDSKIMKETKLWVFILLSIFSALVFANPEEVTDTAIESSITSYEVFEEVLVWGRAIDLIGEVDAASEGIVGYSDFSTRPMLRVGELTEVVPGMIATQHSGGGKANQYFLRGINLDHGTDFSVEFNGMPANMRTHAHGQGYLDLNFIIPELIETIAYKKGTYHADAGDFSAAASTRFKSYERLNNGFIKLTLGSENHQRFVAANSWKTASGDLLLGMEVEFRDGPWENPEDVRKFNLHSKYSTMLGGDEPANVILTAYTNSWQATDQVPMRAIESGALGVFGFVDPSVGGETRRVNLIGEWRPKSIVVNSYLSYYDLNLFGNGTYFLMNPIDGDQIEQEDQRTVVGGSIKKVQMIDLSGHKTALNVGADLRFDNINKLNLFNTASRQRLSVVRQDRVKELSLAGYLNLETQWTDRLRFNIGLRGDFYRWDVEALRTGNSGSGSDSLLSPKLGMAYEFNDAVEIYVNYGRGFHSNDVRAAELSVDPVSGDSADPFDVIVKALGYEVGFRAVLGEHLNFSASLFFLELDSELVFVGDAGTTEPNDASERYGMEATLFWQPLDTFTVDLSLAKTEAKFKDLPPDINHIPDAHDSIASAGITYISHNNLVASVRVRYFGDAPLTEDGAVKKGATTLVNAGLRNPFGNFELGLEILNLLDSDGNDIEYYYESRLSGEAKGVGDLHFHPVEPRQIRFIAEYNF